MDTWASGAREARIGARTAAGLVVSAAGALAAAEVAVVSAGTRPLLVPVAVIAVALVAFGTTLWFTYDRLPGSVLSATALVMVLVVLGTDLLTSDAGGGAQVALLLPVVYAGAFLPPRAAWATAVLAVVSEVVLTFSLLPVEVAVTDASLVVVAIVAVNAVLVSARRRDRVLLTRLEHLASLDSVTGLATRRVFEERAQHALEAPEPTDRRDRAGHDRLLTHGVGMLLIDLDSFKAFNDTYGHPAGDAALVHVSNLLRAGVRAGDTVARLGGDELVVLLPGMGAADLEARAHALRRLVREAPMRWEGDELRLTVSIGVAHARVGVSDVGHLYAAADAALYEAKRAGRDRIAVGTTASPA